MADLARFSLFQSILVGKVPTLKIDLAHLGGFRGPKRPGIGPKGTKEPATNSRKANGGQRESPKG